MKQLRPPLWLFLLPALFLGAFFFYPLINILRLSLSSEAFIRIGESSYFGRIIWFTCWQATLSTLFTLGAGLPAAYIFARFEFAGKKFLRALFTLPFVLPTVTVAAAFRALLGSGGALNQLTMRLFDLGAPPFQLEQSFWLILLAHIFYNVSVLIRLVGGFWSNLPRRYGEAGSSLGASPLRAFMALTLPLLRPALLSAASLIFLFTFTSYGVILILGGPRFSSIETEIYRQYVTFLRPDVAGVLALLQIIFTLLLMIIYARLSSSAAAAFKTLPEAATVERPRTTRQKLTVWLILTPIGLFLLAPLISLLWRSFVANDGSLTINNYAQLNQLYRGSIAFIPPLLAIRNSLVYAILTGMIAGILGLNAAIILNMPSRWKRMLEPLFMLPLGVSAVTLGFGYVVTFSRLRTSPAMVLIAHTLVALPFVARAVAPALASIHPSWREAAASLGANPRQIWRQIELPLIGKSWLVGLAFAFTMSMGEFGATSFIARPGGGYQTIPIAIHRYLGQPGQFGAAMAMSVILTLVVAISFVAMEWLRDAGIGEF